MSQQQEPFDPNVNHQSFYYYNNVNFMYPTNYPQYPIYGYGQQQPVYDQFFQNLYVRKAKEEGKDQNQEVQGYYPNYQMTYQPYGNPQSTRKTSSGTKQHDEQHNKRKNSHSKANNKDQPLYQKKEAIRESPLYKPKSSPYVEKKAEPIYVEKSVYVEKKDQVKQLLSPYVEKKVESLYVEKKKSEDTQQTSSTRKLSDAKEQLIQRSPPQNLKAEMTHTKAHTQFSKEQLVNIFTAIKDTVKPHQNLTKVTDEVMTIVQSQTQSLELEHLIPCNRRKESAVKASPYVGGKNRKDSYNK